MTYRHIAIEGNIGAGKTTLAEKLAAHYGARLVLEEFADNTFLPKFYGDPERYAFPLELSFLADRYKQLKSLLAGPDSFRQPVVTDYTFSKCRLFARINLKEDEYQLFEKLFEIIDLQLSPPDLLIFLQAPVPVLQAHIRQRGRSYEQAIPDEYLQQVEGVYREFLDGLHCRTLVIDTSAADFVTSDDHFDRLIRFLESGTDFRTHYFAVD